METAVERRAFLRLVHDAETRDREWRDREWGWFCTRCAVPAAADTTSSPRICRSCRLGALLQTRGDLLPAMDDPFLIVDDELLVQGVSRYAGALLTVTESEAVGRPVSELLVGAYSELLGDRLTTVIAQGRAAQPVSTAVLPWNAFGVPMRARVLPCGPIASAIVMLERKDQRRLYAVA